jgi:hypothetical protein
VVTAACAALAVASLVFLRLSAAPPLIEIDNPVPAANALFGTGVAGVGDLNGDGTPDLVAGAPGAGAVYVISGADRSVIRTLANPENVAGVRFGYSVAGTGDLTGDGVEDIAVGAPGPEGFLPVPCDPLGGMVCPPPEWGRVFLFSGSTGALIRTLHPSAGDFFTFGFALASIGDVNGDGVPDLAAGSPVLLYSWGQVYAFSGADGSQLWIAQEPGDRQAIASFGVFLAPVADFNADGTRDLVVSAPFFDIDPDPTTYLLAGKVFVLSGATGGILRM